MKIAISTEKPEDVIKIIAWASTNGFGKIEIINTAPAGKSKRKKPLFVKKCEYCGKGFKGNIGLGIHKKKCGKRVIN